MCNFTIYLLLSSSLSLSSFNVNFREYLMEYKSGF